ncbi:MAG: hypothetical protein KGZ80_00715 [Methylomonas sp.]|nr:hypothetical protein [Methylomonas sp.]PPD25828.1 MAG: hypothetical protein CTY22_07285 [Methylomonas sp.]PPD37289.1 MAG: hypothetical protein CTY21_07285 [Methylomonas sp.]PPD39054.1 MAG: hypothetical protein CTY17_08625 [Methylomonas sp.]PPD53000.1 MAG: hypothetical protein CTY11_07615 [Methylomonas sp.]
MNSKPLFIAALLAVLSSAPLSAAVPSLVLQTEPRTILVGDVFSVDVVARNLFAGAYANDQLLAFGFDVDWAPSGLIDLASHTLYPLFEDHSEALGLDLAASAFPGLTAADVIGDVRLATLQFRALAQGSAWLAVNTNSTDPNQGLIFLDQAAVQGLNASLNITAVPLPPAALLFASAACLIRRGKRGKDLA